MLFRKKDSSIRNTTILIAIFIICGVLFTLAGNLSGPLIILVAAFLFTVTDKEVGINDTVVTVKYLTGKEKTFSDVKIAAIRFERFGWRNGLGETWFNKLVLTRKGGKEVTIDVFSYEDGDGIIKELERITGKEVEHKERLLGPQMSNHPKKWRF